MNSDPPPIRAFLRPTTFGDRPYRALLGEDGRVWAVYTIPAANYDRRGGLCLLFDSADVMRRLRNFPDNWYELPDAELYALSLRPTEYLRGERADADQTEPRPDGSVS